MIQVKSMAQHLAETDRLDSLRKGLFPEAYCQDISNIVGIVTTDIVARYNKVCTYRNYVMDAFVVRFFFLKIN